MPIVPPSLDDRRFDDLVDDLIARIPAHTPEWTNPRLGDPGRTLIELFAWLGDALLYRANLVPERQRLVFLKLLGMGLVPARAARGLVGLAYAQPTETRATTVLPGSRVKAAVPFETVSRVNVLPVTAEAYIKRALDSGETARSSAVLQGLARIHQLNGPLKAYRTTPVFSEGRAEPDGVDVFADSADRALWIALFAPAAKPAEQAALNARVLDTLGGAGGGLPALLSVGVAPALGVPQPFEQVSAPTAVPVIWEMTTRGDSDFETDYLTLAVEPGTDSSGGLAQAGTLRLQLPAQRFIWAPSNDVGVNPHAGVGDAPPRLDDAERASRLLAWIRLRPRPGEDVASLRLAWLGINAAEVEQRVTLAGQVLGVSNGMADQRFQLPQGSVDPATLAVEVEETGTGYQPWYRVDDLAALGADPAVGREARAYEVDAESGTLRFGDGLRGRVPEAQMRIRLGQGRFGGGAAGNLPAGSLAELSDARTDRTPAPSIKLAQPLPLDGGADAETLTEAEKRIPGRLRHGDRAVVEDDYRRLAQAVPGVAVGRVEVLARFKPRDRRFDVPGVVSVMALPAADLGPAPNPRPDRPFIERLHTHLAARVPLATELYVIGCEYVAVGLGVAVGVRDGYARDAVLREVREALVRLLWPLAAGGFDGAGWPLGRAVKSRELEVAVARVAGVDEVHGLKLFERFEDAWRALPAGADGAQNLVIQAWQLPELLTVVVTDGATAPADLSAAPNPFAQANAVAVPVVPELC